MSTITTELYIWEFLSLSLEKWVLWYVKAIDGNKVTVARILDGKEFMMNKDQAEMSRVDLQRTLLKQALQLLWDLPEWFTIALSITDPKGKSLFSEAYTWWMDDRKSDN